MISRAITNLCCAAAMLAGGGLAAEAAPFMIVGNDEKLIWDDAGKVVLSPAGKDSVLIVDLADPLNPKIVANLPLKNSVIGPPVNLDIDPTGSIALVADSINVANDNGTLKNAPDDKIYVIDLKAKPAKLIATLTGGKKPSGLSINPAGNLALVANRADKSISVLSIHGTDVKIVDTVPMGDEVSTAVFTPDGKRALVVKNVVNKIAVLNVDAVSVIDLKAPVHVIDHVTVPDSPEGLAFSPKGDLAAAAVALGSNKSKQDWYYHKNGLATILRVNGHKVTKLKDIEVGGLPEAIMFTPDGRYIYVGNYIDQDFSILKVNGTNVTDTGKRFKVPGHPASARMSPH